jgi:hypothetical protein
VPFWSSFIKTRPALTVSSATISLRSTANLKVNTLSRENIVLRRTNDMTKMHSAASGAWDVVSHTFSILGENV